MAARITSMTMNGSMALRRDGRGPFAFPMDFRSFTGLAPAQIRDHVGDVRLHLTARDPVLNLWTRGRCQDKALLERTMRRSALTSRPANGLESPRCGARRPDGADLRPGAGARRSRAASAIVRDAETEALLQDYLAPIFKAAGIRAGQMQVFLIPSDEFNAFVADNKRIFVNVGA